MSQHIGVADKLNRQSAEQLVTMAGAVISGLTGNPAFPASTVDLKAVQAAADALKTALVAQAQGGTAATADKNNKQDALIVLLRKVKHYVEDNCGNDAAVLLSSGFQPAIITRVRAPLGNPSILSVDSGNTGELVLKVTPIARAKSYEVRSAVVGAGNTPGPWQPAGVYTKKRGHPLFFASLTGVHILLRSGASRCRRLKKRSVPWQICRSALPSCADACAA
jgi:hypothetical protein